MRQLEVRCCCDPGKLLGWMHWPKGQEVFEVLLMDQVSIAAWEDSTPIATKRITLELGKFWNGTEYQVAVKDNGATLEDLRRIPGFIEACF